MQKTLQAAYNLARTSPLATGGMSYSYLHGLRTMDPGLNDFFGNPILSTASKLSIGANQVN